MAADLWQNQYILWNTVRFSPLFPTLPTWTVITGKEPAVPFQLRLPTPYILPSSGHRKVCSVSHAIVLHPQLLNHWNIFFQSFFHDPMYFSIHFTVNAKSKTLWELLSCNLTASFSLQEKSWPHTNKRGTTESFTQFQQGTNALVRDTTVLRVQININCFLVIRCQSIRFHIQGHHHSSNIASSSCHCHAKYWHEKDESCP